MADEEEPAGAPDQDGEREENDESENPMEEMELSQPPVQESAGMYTHNAVSSDDGNQLAGGEGITGNAVEDMDFPQPTGKEGVGLGPHNTTAADDDNDNQLPSGDDDGVADADGQPETDVMRTGGAADADGGTDEEDDLEEEEDTGLRKKRTRVDDDDAQGDDDDDGAAAHDDEELHLEEEDYELVDEASRPRKKARKLQRAGERRKSADTPTTAEQNQQMAHEGEPIHSVDEDRNAAAVAQRKHQEQQQHQQDKHLIADDDVDDEDENLGGFIVDAEDEDEEGEGAERAGQRKHRRVKKGSHQVPLQSVQEAEDIFGDVDEMIEEYQQAQRAAEGSATSIEPQGLPEGVEQADEGEVPEEEEEVDEEVLRDAGYTEEEIIEEREQRKRAQLQRQRSVAGAQAAHQQVTSAALSRFEPGLLQKRYLSDEDERIRKADVSERLQLRERKLGAPKSGTSFKPEAKWILRQILQPQTGSSLEYEVLTTGELDDREAAYGIDFTEYADRYQNEWRAFEAQEHAGRIQAALSGSGNNISKVPEYDELVDAIEFVLHATHVERLEIPFIAMHRKEDIYPLLRCRSEEAWNPTDLQYDLGLADDVERQTDPNRPNLRRWELLHAVLEWDSEWMSLQRRRQELERRLTLSLDESKHGATEELSDAERGKLNELRDQLQNADTQEDMDDLSNFVRMYTRERNPESAHVGSLNKPKSRSARSIYRSKGVHLLTQKFGLEPVQVAENVTIGYQQNAPRDWDEAPETAARTLLKSGMSRALSHPTHALEQARQLFALEVAGCADLRRYVRQTFFKHAFISTSPTEQGKFELDPFHPLAKTKHLKRKPVTTFKDDLFIRCLQAEDERLIELTVDIPNGQKDTLRTELSNALTSDNMRDAATQWNKQRHELVEECLDQHIFPTFRRQVRTILQRAGKKRLKAACKETLWSHASVAPLQLKANKSVMVDSDKVQDMRVVAACAGTPSNVVALSSEGELVDYLSLGHITDRPTPTQSMKPQFEADKSKLNQFIQINKPHVCVVGCSGWESNKLHESMKEAVMTASASNAIPDDVDEIRCLFRDTSIARLWEVAAKQTEKWKYHPYGVLHALALGRLMLDPLPVICSLAGQGMELRSLQMSTVQRNLSSAELDQLIEEVLVTATNQVGVGLQSIARDSWKASPLQFLAGLGPRKARHMQLVMQTSERKEVLVSHRVHSKQDSKVPFYDGYATDLTSTGALTTNVCMNALSFLKVDMEDPSNLLDSSRIHPRDYKYALEMAASALVEEGAEQLDLPRSDEEAFDKIREAKKKKYELRALNIPDYNAMNQQSRSVNILVTLHDIRHELMFPYMEWRKSWQPPDDEQKLYWLSGERLGCPLVGRLVRATVIAVNKSDPDIAAICVLDNGLKGEVTQSDLTSSTDASSVGYTPRDLLVQGQSLQARIIDVHTQSMRVKLATRRDYLVETKLREYESRYCGDENYYDTSASVYTGEPKDKPRDRDSADTAEGLTVPAHRAIDHANFRNYNQKQAEEVLDEYEAGTHVFRPSSKGTDHVSMTMRIGERAYLHMDIEESQKSTQGGAQLKLGTPLRVGNDSFEDLDHLESELVTPLSAVVQSVAKHRKCRPGTKEEVDKQLASEKQAHRGSIPYAITPSQEMPGKIMLSYCPNISSCHVRHEFITPQANGLRFRGKVHRDADRLINWFKRRALQS